MRPWRTGLAVLGLAALAACGGGEQVEPFAPTRIVAFGDENSVLDDETPNTPVAGVATGNGRNFSVNFIDTTVTPAILKCANHPVWTQIIAANFGLTFEECNPGNVANATGIIRAQVNARVAGLDGQINTHLASSTFGPQDLVTVYVGMHDILDLYSTVDVAPGPAQVDVDALADQARARGAALALQINRIADADGRVIYTTIQDLGLSPFGLAQKARGAVNGVDRAALLSRLTNSFNLGVKATVINDGRKIGLVTGDELSKIIVANAGANGFNNVTEAVCGAVAVGECTTQTLVANGNASTHYWADSTHLSPGGHNRLGLAAVARARGNPF